MAIRKTKKSFRKNKSNRWEIEIPWYVWAIGVVVIVGIVFWVVFSSVGQVKYEGLVFQAEKYGTTVVYHNSYLLKMPNGEVIKYNLYLHNNPKKNDVPLNAEIIYPEFMAEVKLGINTSGLTKCPESSLAVGSLSEFILNNGFTIKVGTTNSSISNEHNITYMTCETHPNDFMIFMSEGDKTQITQQGNCIKIEVANCEIQPAVEKFIVESIVQARERAKQ